MTYLVNDKCIKCKHTTCVEVCPVKIPITEILLRLRRGKVENIIKDNKVQLLRWEIVKEILVWKIWSVFFSNILMYRLLNTVISKIGSFIPIGSPIIRNWSIGRVMPDFPQKNLHQLVKEEGFSEE